MCDWSSDVCSSDLTTRSQRRQAHQADRDHRKKRRAKVAGIVASLSPVAVAGVTATWSAFSGPTSNPGNTFSAGPVELTEHDADAAMFSRWEERSVGNTGVRTCRVR